MSLLEFIDSVRDSDKENRIFYGKGLSTKHVSDTVNRPSIVTNKNKIIKTYVSSQIVSEDVQNQKFNNIYAKQKKQQSLNGTNEKQTSCHNNLEKARIDRKINLKENDRQRFNATGETKADLDKSIQNHNINRTKQSFNANNSLSRARLTSNHLAKRSFSLNNISRSGSFRRNTSLLSNNRPSLSGGFSRLQK